MAIWDNDKYYEMFGDHYDKYKRYMRDIDELKTLKQQLYETIYLGNTEVSRQMKDIVASYQNLADNLDSKNYSWNGDDMRACWQKVLEMRDDLKQTIHLKKEACESVMAVIDEQCEQFGRYALYALSDFNIFDKITGTVDVTLQAAKEQLERLTRAL